MELYTTLIERGYAPSMVQRMVPRLETLHKAYTEALWAFLNAGEMHLLRSHGYSTRRLMRDAGLGYVQALSLIIWLETDPEEAMTCLETGFAP